MPQVIKRNGKKVDFDREKIVIAIEKAMHSSSGVYVENQALEIAKEIEALANNKELPLSIYDIESEVYYRLIQNDNPATARAYESYKSVQQYKREQNTTDEGILGLRIYSKRFNSRRSVQGHSQEKNDPCRFS